MPKAQAPKLHGAIVDVPVGANKTYTLLPITENKTYTLLPITENIVMVNLKKKSSPKGHFFEPVRIEKTFKALKYLKTTISCIAILRLTRINKA